MNAEPAAHRAATLQPPRRETLVLLPGLLCDEAVWADQVEALSDVADCIVVDHGDCDSIEAMAEAVLSMALPATFALAGHSMGGRVALEVVRRAPERVARLALLDTGYQARPDNEVGEREREQRLALLALAQAEGMRRMGEQWAVGMVHPERVREPLFEAILRMIERNSTARFAAQIEALLHRPDATPVLARIDCPSLLLCGREDLWSPLARHVDMRDAIRGARLEIVERSGHMTTMEQPESTSRALRAWLDGWLGT
jgi:pimeloyl-ACP methyl ester carboxylesterase